MVKEPQGAFQPEGKEPVIDRLTQLVRRYASRSAAARAWGISVNTLNSYYKTSVEPPMPRENLLANIAAHEGVSLEWLKTGNTSESPKSPVIIKGGDTQDELSRMLSFLTQDEREQLTMTLARKGLRQSCIYSMKKISSFFNAMIQRRKNSWSAWKAASKKRHLTLVKM